MAGQAEGIAAFARRMTARRIARLGLQVDRAQRDLSPETVHDLRVAARRLQYTLDCFRSLLAGRKFRRLRKRAKAVLSAGGKVRDRDIALEIAAKVGLAPTSELVEALRCQREAAARSLRILLERRRYRRFSGRWTRRLGNPPGMRARMSDTRQRSGWDAAESSASNGHRVLPHLASEFLALGGEVFAGTPTPERLHDLRLAGKRLRYSLELFRESYGPELEGVLRTLKKIQRALGRISDCDATERLVRSTGLADAEGATELVQAIELDRSATTRTFLLRWRRFFRSTEAGETWARALGDHAAGGPENSRSSADLP